MVVILLEIDAECSSGQVGLQGKGKAHQPTTSWSELKNHEHICLGDTALIGGQIVYGVECHDRLFEIRSS